MVSRVRSCSLSGGSTVDCRIRGALGGIDGAGFTDMGVETLIFELDRLCRKRALIASSKLPRDAALFVNCMPSTIHDPEFKGAYLSEMLDDGLRHLGDGRGLQQERRW